jgi:hypothetical protein
MEFSDFLDQDRARIRSTLVKPATVEWREVHDPGDPSYFEEWSQEVSRADRPEDLEDRGAVDIRVPEV